MVRTSFSDSSAKRTHSAISEAASSFFRPVGDANSIQLNLQRRKALPKAVVKVPADASSLFILRAKQV